jgi:trimeric autotransporter adhesin
MANERVTHQDGTKSTVIAAGGAFMSNFEIQVEVDNAGTLPYGNYNILQNIIASLTNISTIAEVRNMPNGTDVVIEGIATTDVYNGGDSNKGFFDCIYVQDQTGGINLFPVSSGVEVGQKIRVTGTVSEYQGEKQIQNAKVTVINSDKNLVVPKSVTPQEAMSSANTGNLVTFKGTVTEIIKGNDGTVGQLMVSGARVYINAYITKNISLANIKEGDTVQVTGISSIGENMSSDTEFLPRIRIFDRGEIIAVTTVPVPVTGISLNVSDKALETGNQFTLEAAITPENAANKTVIWSSSNTEVATVSESGKVTAVSPGDAIITVTTEDGGYTAVCNVKVNSIIPFEIVKTSPSTNEFTLGSDAVVTIQVRNKTTVEKEATLIVALYDNNNRFISYVSVGQFVGPGKTIYLNARMSLPTTGQYKVKCFVWDNMDHMNALSQVIEIPVK